MELTRDEIRRPDVVTKELQQGFMWTTQHSQLVLGLIALFLVVGFAWAGWQTYNSSREQKWADKFATASIGYQTKKADFDQFIATSNLPVDPKTKKAPEAKGIKATGDLTQDYGTVVNELEAIVTEAPKTPAAAQSAFLLSEIYLQYKKPDMALEAMKKVQNVSGDLGALSKMSLGTLYANVGNCQLAVDTWKPLLQAKDAGFVSAQARFRSALCLESLGNKDLARTYYEQVTKDAKDTGLAKTAEKYMRRL